MSTFTQMPLLLSKEESSLNTNLRETDSKEVILNTKEYSIGLKHNGYVNYVIYMRIKPFNFLLTLVEKENQLVFYNELIERCCKDNEIIELQQLWQYQKYVKTVSNLLFLPIVIKNVRSRGFILINNELTFTIIKGE